MSIFTESYENFIFDIGCYLQKTSQQACFNELDNVRQQFAKEVFDKFFEIDAFMCPIPKF